MQKHLGRVVRFGWLPAIGFAAMVISDMSAAVINGDKNIAALLKNLGLDAPPEHVATYIWTHPWAVVLTLAVVFAVGGIISWGIEALCNKITHKKISDDKEERFIPIWEVVSHVARSIGDGDENKCFEKARNKIRQAAVDGKIKFRGRAELRPPHKPGFHSAIWTEIPESYWIKAEINPLASGVAWQEHDHTMQEPFDLSGFKNRYWTLLVRKSDIEREWP